MPDPAQEMSEIRNDYRGSVHEDSPPGVMAKNNSITVDGEVRFPFYLSQEHCTTLRAMVRHEHRVMFQEHDSFNKLWLEQKVKKFLNSLVVKVLSFAGLFVLFVLWTMSNGVLADVQSDIHDMQLTQALMSTEMSQLHTRLTLLGTEADGLQVKLDDASAAAVESLQKVNDTKRFLSDEISLLRTHTATVLDTANVRIEDSVGNLTATMNVRLEAINAIEKNIDAELEVLKVQTAKVIVESKDQIQAAIRDFESGFDARLHVIDTLKAGVEALNVTTLQANFNLVNGQLRNLGQYDAILSGLQAQINNTLQNVQEVKDRDASALVPLRTSIDSIVVQMNITRLEIARNDARQVLADQFLHRSFVMCGVNRSPLVQVCCLDENSSDWIMMYPTWVASATNKAGIPVQFWSAEPIFRYPLERYVCLVPTLILVRLVGQGCAFHYTQCFPPCSTW